MLEHLGNPVTRRWEFGPSISWHFPTRVDRARVRATEAGAAAALARFDGVVLDALRETRPCSRTTPMTCIVTRH